MKTTNKPETIEKIKKLYYGDLLSMSEVAKRLNISLDSVVYLMRKNKLKRRSLVESSKITFQNKPASFQSNKLKSTDERCLEIAGLMLYWAEGAKSDKCVTVDFANSDPRMIKVFLRFLRSSYVLNESRFRVLLYCYSNQDLESLIHFWSKLTKIPKSSFTKPYVRNDFKENGRIMKYGMIHVRYNDKKLLIDLMKKISYYIDVFNA